MEGRRMSVNKGQTYVLTDRAGFTHTVTVDHVAEYLFDDDATENAIVDGNGLEWPLGSYRADRPGPFWRVLSDSFLRSGWRR